MSRITPENLQVVRHMQESLPHHRQDLINQEAQRIRPEMI